MPVLRLKLSAKTAGLLAREAARRQVSEAAVMREALYQKLRESARAPSVYDLMKGSLGCIDSRLPDLAHNPARLVGFGRF
jgi:hypothetical protein